MIEDEITAIVAEHYASPSGRRLLMLSNLGARLSKDGHWPLASGDRRTLLDVVKSAPGLSVVSDPDSKSFIAVVPKGQEQRVQQAIELRHRLYFLRGLPKALLLAFTVPLAEGQQIFVRLRPRPSYVVGDPGDDSAVAVDPELRLPGLEVEALEEAEEAAKLDANIREWCARHQIDPTTLARKSPPSAEPARPGPKATNALERLYAAQDSDVARRLVMPMDIALILSRLP